jgi:cell wall-associated NlpC family hydrolase
VTLDPRITPARPDLASRALEGLVRATAYADPKTLAAIVPALAIRAAPRADAEQVDQLLFGERFEVLEEAAGFAWGQARRDGYVGFVERIGLAEAAAPTHRVSALRTYAFAEPSIKAAALGPYSINALVSVEAEEGRFRKARGCGWFVESHLAPIGLFDDDPVAVAQRFLGAPYLWGGRDSLGVDCSGLVQQALLACGRACPRDTDQQMALGTEVTADALARGDLVFWRGHVAMMLDPSHILHANAHHMATAVESLAEAVARIAAAGSGQPIAFRRV